MVIPEGLLQSRVELDHLRRQLQVRFLSMGGGMCGITNGCYYLTRIQSPCTHTQTHTQQHVQRAGLNPLVCLTHVDMAYPVLRQNPNVCACLSVCG